MKKVFQMVLFGIGVVFVLYSIILLVISNFNMGIVITLCLGFFLMGSRRLYERICRMKSKCLARSLKATAIVVVLGFFAIISMLVWAGQNNTTRFNEDAVIVLGSGIHGERISATLKNRLDAAIKYWDKNPKAYIVVSGGQGPQEDISESLAMKRYLLKHNIPEQMILMEDKSTSTYENFAFSKELLDNKFPKGYTTTFVTNYFHVYRAGKVAALAGLSTTSYGAKTRWYMIPNVYGRESLVVLKCWIFGYGGK